MFHVRWLAQEGWLPLPCNLTRICSPRFVGKRSELTRIFFEWVGPNHQVTSENDAINKKRQANVLLFMLGFTWPSGCSRHEFVRDECSPWSPFAPDWGMWSLAKTVLIHRPLTMWIDHPYRWRKKSGQPFDMVDTPWFVGFHTCQVLSRISYINSSIRVDLCFYWWGWGPEV